jgi:hypothetical protein
MRIGRFTNSKFVFAFLLIVLSWGMLFAEAHGILGHAHYTPAGASESEYSTSSAQHSMEFLASGRNSDDHPCGICYCYRLLGQSLVPHAYNIFDSSFDIQPILVHCIRLIHTSAIKTGNRSPPQA